jgi:hypothetical protein
MSWARQKHMRAFELLRMLMPARTGCARLSPQRTMSRFDASADFFSSESSTTPRSRRSVRAVSTIPHAPATICAGAGQTDWLQEANGLHLFLSFGLNLTSSSDNGTSLLALEHGLRDLRGIREV